MLGTGIRPTNKKRTCRTFFFGKQQFVSKSSTSKIFFVSPLKAFFRAKLGIKATMSEDFVPFRKTMESLRAALQAACWLCSSGAWLNSEGPY